MSTKRISAVVVLAVTLIPSSALCSGMYLSDRGVRPMGRGGAFVAGGDELGALSYNPAALGFTDNSILFDVTYPQFSTEYTRKLRIVDADGTIRYVTSPTVNGEAPFLPIPSMMGSMQFGKNKEWNIAAGMLVPYFSFATYSPTIDGQPSPARYSLSSFDGTIAALPGLWLSYKPHPRLAIGAGFQALIGKLQSLITFSVSLQDRLLGAPEQPDFDAQSQLSVGPIFAPTASLGVIWAPLDMLRLGISGQLPMVINAPARLKVRLPTNVVFDSAKIVGDEASVRMVLPGSFKAGIEVRPVKNLRAEVAYVREFWSGHSSIDANPKDIRIEGIIGGPPSLSLPQIAIPRNFRDSNSIRIGGEYSIPLTQQMTLDLRMGLSYDTAAVPSTHLSLYSFDTSKTILAFGGSLHLSKRLRLDTNFAHVFASTEYVNPDEAQIPRINPIKGNAPLEAINGGTYRSSGNLIGIGMQYKY